MPDCYAAMDLFVTATWREGFPRAAMEASAMALAVVATDVRGCRQVVDDGHSGRLVPVRNPRALATALAELVNDLSLRQRMGAAARARALVEFDQQRVIDRTLAAYAEIARVNVPRRDGRPDE
jgi:glycosyltransferase involved in cell wall biosynthesis